MTEDNKQRMSVIDESLTEARARLTVAGKDMLKSIRALDKERVEAVIAKRAIKTAIVQAHNSAVENVGELEAQVDALVDEQNRLIETAEREKASDLYQRVLSIRRRAEAPRIKLYNAMNALIQASTEAMALLMESPQTWADIAANPGDILFPSESTPQDVYRGFEERALRALIFGRCLELGKIANR